jgi:hypothetical protein
MPSTATPRFWQHLLLEAAKRRIQRVQWHLHRVEWKIMGKQLQ